MPKVTLSLAAVLSGAQVGVQDLGVQTSKTWQQMPDGFLENTGAPCQVPHLLRQSSSPVL